jgi:3',5'-cyclic AMP phosphodiesterase CpdA
MVLSIIILLGMMSPAFGENGISYQAKNPEKLIMSFVAVSDIHVETNNPDSYQAFSDILEGIKAGKNHDAVVYLGDNVMNGQLTENLLFYTGVKAAKPSENNYVLMGNHDIGNGHGDYNELCDNYIKNNRRFLGNDLDKPYYYKVLNGCYMICLASEELSVNTCIMSEEQLLWLENVLDEADGENAPIFVFNHHPIDSLTGVESDALVNLLNKYDRVLYIHGHTHYQMAESSFRNVGGVDTINLPRSSEVVDYEPGDGIVVEIYEDEILVRGRNFIDGEWKEGLEFIY